MPLLIQSALVADAHRVGIVATGVRPHSRQRTGNLYLAASADVIVIPDKTPMVHLHMVVVKLLHRVSLVATGG